MELKPKATESKASQYEAELEAHLSTLLEPGETLRGFCSASQQKNMFSGGVVTLATTDRRLIIQTLDRKGKVKTGEFVSLDPSQVKSVKIGGAGGAWDDPSAVIMNRSAIQLKIKTTGGQKYKFTLMDGTGIFGSFGGGDMQRNGVGALREFLGEADSSI